MQSKSIYFKAQEDNGINTKSAKTVTFNTKGLTKGIISTRNNKNAKKCNEIFFHSYRDTMHQHSLHWATFPSTNVTRKSYDRKKTDICETNTQQNATLQYLKLVERHPK